MKVNGSPESSFPAIVVKIFHPKPHVNFMKMPEKMIFYRISENLDLLEALHEKDHHCDEDSSMNICTKLLLSQDDLQHLPAIVVYF